MENVIEEYFVVEETSLYLLICVVNELLKAGWEPRGGASVCHTYEDRRDQVGRVVYFQAMIRKKSAAEVCEISGIPLSKKVVDLF